MEGKRAKEEGGRAAESPPSRQLKKEGAKDSQAMESGDSHGGEMQWNSQIDRGESFSESHMKSPFVIQVANKYFT
ncbi:hypothetical protein CJ030_MR0G003721 [Morella rubra]|uniref:Uncharacterized protein n=1 Tax=Morella rubra TaxID=262757 RepID=A0A6A1UMD4_9ROSI|nr:hypothetical protein CJ030_MR0G003721 [Morella rubra]